MKTKQIISIALMLALLVSVITGCGTKEDPSTNNNEESTSAVSSEIKENEESKAVVDPGPDGGHAVRAVGVGSVRHGCPG